VLGIPLLLFFYVRPAKYLAVTGVAFSNARTQRFVPSNLSFRVITKIIIFVMHIYVDLIEVFFKI